MQSGLVSVLIPLYNEEAFIAEVISRVLAASLPAGYRVEIVVVDDGSIDQSASIVEKLQARHVNSIHLIRSGQNRGKGAAVRIAIQAACGEFCVIQDADLEYNPSDFSRLLRPLLVGSADVVYGSRFAKAPHPRYPYYWHSLANRLLTRLTNCLSGLRLTDVLTGYKAFRTALVKTVPLRNDRFGIEPELTMKLAKRGVRFCEVPISYAGRTYREGKKVRLKDAFEAVGVILYYWMFDDLGKPVARAAAR